MRLQYLRIAISKGRSIVFAASLLSSPSVGETVSRPKAEYAEPEAYRVYEAILPENRAYRDASLVLIRGRTVFYPSDCLTPNLEREPLVEAAIADYKRVNRLSLKLARLLQIQKKYEVLSEAEFSGIPISLRDSTRWRRHRVDHPNFPGFIELSGVGFSKDKTVAIVYIVKNCGPLCSAGHLIVLQKRAGEWTPMRGLGCFWNS